jgi:hypothetical protein
MLSRLTNLKLFTTDRLGVVKSSEGFYRATDRASRERDILRTFRSPSLYRLIQKWLKVWTNLICKLKKRSHVIQFTMRAWDCFA